MEHEHYYGSGMNAVESVGNAEHKRYYGLGMEALESVGDAEHKHYYGLGLDALENVGEAEARQLPELVQAKTPNNIDGKLTSQKYP